MNPAANAGSCLLERLTAFSKTPEINVLGPTEPPFSYYLLIIWGWQRLQIVVTKFSVGFHLMFILSSSNIFSRPERSYETGVKDVKIASRRGDNAPKMGFWKRLCPFMVEANLSALLSERKRPTLVKSQFILTP